MQRSRNSRLHGLGNVDMTVSDEGIFDKLVEQTVYVRGELVAVGGHPVGHDVSDTEELNCKARPWEEMQGRFS